MTAASPEIATRPAPATPPTFATRVGSTVGPRRNERGMVTAEAALVIPVLLAVTLTLSWAIAVGAAQVRLIDAAREGARLAGRGESAAVVDAAVRRAGPEGTSGTVATSDGTVDVRVQAEVSPDLPLLGDVGSVSLSAQATAADEETGLP